MRSAALIPILAWALGGCVQVSVDGSDGDFTARSALWVAIERGTDTSHEFVLSSTPGYCGEYAEAEQGRLDAWARHEERLAVEQGECESYDLYLDDLADSYAVLQGEGAHRLTLRLSRLVDESSGELDSSPVAGTYKQGQQGDRFDGLLEWYEADVARQRADAFACLGPDEIDEEAWDAFQVTLDGDTSPLQQRLVTEGELVVEELGERRRRAELVAQLLAGTLAVGSLDVSFTATRCDVDLVE